MDCGVVRCWYLFSQASSLRNSFYLYTRRSRNYTAEASMNNAFSRPPPSPRLLSIYPEIGLTNADGDHADSQTRKSSDWRKRARIALAYVFNQGLVDWDFGFGFRARYFFREKKMQLNLFAACCSEYL